MSILTANLKFFYQCPALWIVYAIMGQGCILFYYIALSYKSDSPYPDSGFLSFMCMGLIFFGVVCGSLWRETLGKPFSFCLPKSQNVPGKVMLISGVSISLPISFLYLSLCHPETFRSAFRVFISVFFTGMDFFLIAALLTFRFAKRDQWQIVFYIFLIFVCFPSLSQKIEPILISHPLSFMFLGIGLGLFLSFRIGQRELRRKLCLTSFIGILDKLDPAKMKRYKEQSTIHKYRPQNERRQERLESFFLARMKQYEVLGMGRNFWGMLYRFLGNPGQIRGQRALGVLFYTAVLAFWLFTQSSWMVFVLSSIFLGIEVPLPLTQSMLFPVGRKEQFRTVIHLQAAYTVLLMIGLLGLGVFWQGLFLMVPPITLAGLTLTCAPFEWTYFYIPVLLMPVNFLIRGFALNFDPFVSTILATAVALPGFFLFPWLIQKEPWLIIALSVGFWPLCFLVYWNYFRRANLVGQESG